MIPPWFGKVFGVGLLPCVDRMVLLLAMTLGRTQLNDRGHSLSGLSRMVSRIQKVSKI
jgi:hypothetical protein